MSWNIGKLKDAAKGQVENIDETKAFSHWLKNYPLFAPNDLLKEIMEFEKDFIDSGIISPMSSNYNKYLRGYLVKAHKIKGNAQCN